MAKGGRSVSVRGGGSSITIERKKQGKTTHVRSYRMTPASKKRVQKLIGLTLRKKRALGRVGRLSESERRLRS